MMVSNGLSARRGPLRRPKVCLTHPNPGRCEPPPPPGNISCSLTPQWEGSIEVEEQDTINWYACNTDYDDTLMLEPEVTVLLGEPPNVEEHENCTEGANIDYEAPSDPGVEVVTLFVEWPDGSSCQAQCSFLVVEEEEEE